MTTRAAAVYGFLSGFGIPAYASTSTPDQAAFPYLTYDLVLPEWGQGEMTMTVNLWYRGDSEAPANAKAEEIGQALGIGGVLVPFDDGALWLKKGSPFVQSMGGEDDKVKRRYINIDIEATG